MLQKLRALGEAQMPWIFGAACLVFDRRAARNPDNEVNLLPLFVAAGDVACDIGANRGLFTYWLLKRGVQVQAFEPNPHMARVLRSRFGAALGSGRLKLFNVALSDAGGEATLHIPVGFSPLATIDGRLADQAGKPMEQVKVPLSRLDDCVSGEIAFIKLDVEGHELKVLEGAQRLLAACHPSILVEAEERHRPGAVASLRALLEPLGYQGFFRDKGATRPIAAFDPAVHQRADALTPDGTHAAEGKTYINNFIFAARPQVLAKLAP